MWVGLEREAERVEPLEAIQARHGCRGGFLRRGRRHGSDREQERRERRHDPTETAAVAAVGVGHCGDMRPHDWGVRRVAKLLERAGVELDVVHPREYRDTPRLLESLRFAHRVLLSDIQGKSKLLG